MNQEHDQPNEERTEPIMFTDDWDTADVVINEGITVEGVITTYQEKPDPHDDEHTIFMLEYEYEVTSQLFQRAIECSINTVHIAYGYAGELYNTPKFRYSLDDFRNAMQPGQKLMIRALPRDPYWFLVEANEVMAEVMSIMLCGAESRTAALPHTGWCSHSVV